MRRWKVFAWAGAAGVVILVCATSIASIDPNEWSEPDQTHSQRSPAPTQPPAVAAPSLVAAGAGQPEVGTPIEFDPPGRLTGPHVDHVFLSVASVTTIDAELAEELAIWHAPRLDWLPGQEIHASDGHELLVSVPEGEGATLVLIDHDRPQSLELRTGALGDDKVPLLYDPLSTTTEFVADEAAAVNAGFYPMENTSIGRTDNGSHVLVFMSEVAVGLEPFHHDAGWAEPGRAWLVLELQFVTPGGYSLGAAESFTLVEPDGRRTTAEPAVLNWIIEPPTTTLLPPRRTPSAVFDVPEDFRSGTVLFGPARSAENGSIRPVVPATAAIDITG